MATQSSLRQPAHVHAANETCPVCDQPVDHEKFVEIAGRLKAQEHERSAELTARLEEQFQHDKALAETAAREAAELAAAEKLQAAESARAELEVALQAKVAAAEEARKGAEQAGVGLRQELEQLKAAAGETLERVQQEAAAREAQARVEERAAAEASVQERLLLLEQEKLAAEKLAQETAAAQEAAIGERVQEVREALEKAKDEAVNSEKAKAYAETLKLQEKLGDVQRQLEKKSNEELGDGAEIELFDALREEFPTDRIVRVVKGSEGADIIHVVVHNGKDCGQIVYDSKNRNAWKNEYVRKLAIDQMAQKAEHAILSTRKLPAHAKHQCLEDGIIVANPARVVFLVQLLRRHILQTHSLRLGAEARVQKTAALYDFIMSEQCHRLFERILTETDDLLALQESEMKAHKLTWERQGKLIKSVQRVRAEMLSEIDQIIGTAAEPAGTA